MIYELTNNKSIRGAAECLAHELKQQRQPNVDLNWTDQNFARLQEFCVKHLGVSQKDCFYRRHPGGNKEFLWDFLAATRDRGAVLAAESEQFTTGMNLQQDLKHDFEKLLYVFAPIRVLICNSPRQDDPGNLVKELTEYANGCCQQFNPGSVFLLHFTMPNNHNGGSDECVSYIWQSRGKYEVPELEKLDFGEPL